MPHAHRHAFAPRSPGRFRRRVLGALGAVILLALCAAPAIAKKTPPAQPIDLNAANIKELEELPGIGPTTAKAIIDFRTKSGRFRRVNDLLVIRGISEAKLARIRPYVTLGPPPKPSPPPKPAQEVALSLHTCFQLLLRLVPNPASRALDNTFRPVHLLCSSQNSQRSSGATLTTTFRGSSL